ncbi:Hypothetical protein BIBO2_0592 [Brucella sp. BO2]|nr:Hypothetical protein BIBO2_0592 [Brucella sp. BO2]
MAAISVKRILQANNQSIFEPKVRSAYAGKSVHWTDF